MAQAYGRKKKAAESFVKYLFHFQYNVETQIHIVGRPLTQGNVRIREKRNIAGNVGYHDKKVCQQFKMN